MLYVRSPDSFLGIFGGLLAGVIVYFMYSLHDAGSTLNLFLYSSLSFLGPGAFRAILLRLASLDFLPGDYDKDDPYLITEPLQGLRRGTNGVGTNGVTAIFIFDRGTFWVPICQNLSKSITSAYLFPQSVKIHYICSGPIRVDPICPATKASASSAPSGCPRCTN